MSEIKVIMIFGVIAIILSKYISLISGVEESIHKYINYRHLTYKKRVMLKETHFINHLLYNAFIEIESNNELFLMFAIHKP